MDEEVLSQSVVKVVIPKERHILMIIHRMVEFVIREGPMFEAMIMNKEINNPLFRFLFENQSPTHVYYRWKLFSLLQGDSPKQWSTKDFRMFKGGSIWRPPVMNVYTQGMPEELIEEDEIKDTKGTLSKTQRERLEELIRQLSPEAFRVGEAMVFCMEHAEAADEIADCLAEALSMPSTALHKKVARIYLVSDILHNSGIWLNNASSFRKSLEVRLVQIMRDLHSTWQCLDSRLQADGFRARVGAVLAAWNDWAVYPRDFLLRLHNTFNGIETKDPDPTPEDADNDGDEDGDGDDPDGEEGGPLDGAALLKAAQGLQLARASIPAIPLQDNHDDIDGVPMDDDIDGVPLEESSPPRSLVNVPRAVVPGFVPSRWESVEPGRVEAEAVTSQRWQAHSPVLQSASPPAASPPSPDTNDLGEVSDERRLLLRSVEVRAMEYQDELEAGQRQLRPGWTLSQQVQHYRRKLIKKAEREAKEKEDSISGSPERVIMVDKKSHRDKERERDRDRERESRGARSGSSEDGYNTSNSRKSKKSREISLSPPSKRSHHRSRSPMRSKSSRQSSSKRGSSPSPPLSPPPPPNISHHARRPEARKHKHKHKY